MATASSPRCMIREMSVRCSEGVESGGERARADLSRGAKLELKARLQISSAASAPPALRFGAELLDLVPEVGGDIGHFYFFFRIEMNGLRRFVWRAYSAVAVIW